MTNELISNHEAKPDILYPFSTNMIKSSNDNVNKGLVDRIPASKNCDNDYKCMYIKNKFIYYYFFFSNII